MSEALKAASFALEENSLIVTFKEEDAKELSTNKALKILLVDRQLNSSSECKVSIISNEGTFGFVLPLNQIEFSSEDKSIIDIFVYKNDSNLIRIMKPLPDYKDRSLKYLQIPYHINEQKICVAYLTTKNELSFLYGSKEQVYKSFCTYVDGTVLSNELDVRNNHLILTTNQINFDMMEDFYFEVKNKDNTTDSMCILRHEKLDNHTITLDLCSSGWSLCKEYDLFLHIKYGRIIQTLRILMNMELNPTTNYPVITIDKELKILPYISTMGAVSLKVVNQLLYSLEANAKEIYFERIHAFDNKISINFCADSPIPNIKDKKCELVLVNKATAALKTIPSDNLSFSKYSLSIDLANTISSHELNKDTRWEIYLKTSHRDNNSLEIFRFINHSHLDIERNYGSISLNDDASHITFLSTKSNLEVLSGHKYTLLKQIYKTIDSKICIHHLNFLDNKIEFKLSELQINKIEALKISLKLRNSEETWEEYIEPSTILTNGFVSIDIKSFIDLYQYNKSRWDFYLDVAHDGIIESGKIGCFNDELSPKHLRYFSPIAAKSNNIFVPYLTVYNELSLVINEKVIIDNEKVSHNISLTNFKMNKAKLTCVVELELPEIERFTVNSLMLKFRGKADEVIEYSLPVQRVEADGLKKRITLKLYLSNYEFQPFYWDLYLLINADGNSFSIKVKNPSPEVKKAINNKITGFSFTFENGYFIYPYISESNSLALTYREKPSYESAAFKIKEKLAYYTYRLTQGYWERKDIWLAYEKFAEGAQDNGYYFFKYCYDNNKKDNFYYIIKKDSPDYENVASMNDKVVKFMSFKYMMLLYASKLLISSESKGHIYDIRIQKGRLKNALKKKKHVFLQHGVTALKRVDYVFKKTKNNAVDLFVATSDYEKEIIKKFFGYEEHEIITTGFCRWDVLEDTSKDNREIFVMPTWRTWMDDLPEEQFIESDYYKNYVGFFKSELLKKLLADNNVKMSFYIHPKFKTYIDSFNIDHSNIKIYQYGEEKVNKLLMKTSMLITDYSSVAWEMFYQKKPVVFFQFDVEKYNAFQGSYLDMETELFGDRVFDVSQLVNSVHEYIEKDFKEKEEYGRLRNKYFKYVDKNNCERTYNAIKNSFRKK